jgi:hypothetical protein
MEMKQKENDENLIIKQYLLLSHLEKHFEKAEQKMPKGC